MFLASFSFGLFMPACCPQRSPTAIGYPPTAIGYPPTAIGYPPTAIGYTPTAIGYPPTAIVRCIGHSEFLFFHYGTPWLLVAVDCVADVAQKRVDQDEGDSYYNDEECEDDVNPEVAAKGAGKIGSVALHESLWSRCVPENLKDKYESGMTEARGGGVSRRV